MNKLNKMRKPCISLTFITLIICADIVSSAPVQKSLQSQLNPYYLKAMAAYKKLEPKLPREELRALTTIGILNGAKQAEQQMERHLIDAVKDLLLNTDLNDKENVLPKIEKIEKQLHRDQKALEILSKSMDLAMKSKDVKTFKQEMQSISEANRNPTISTINADDNNDVGQHVSTLRQQIIKQMDIMKSVVDDKIDDTLEYLIEHSDANSLLAKASNRMLQKRHVVKEEPAAVREITELEEDDFRNNLVISTSDDKHSEALKADFDDDDDNLLFASNNVIETNSNNTNNKNNNNIINSNINKQTMTVKSMKATDSNMTLAKQEEGSPELFDNNNDMPAGGGGLVGIITSLSGGEGGSDIGALIGALTGVISQLFGPNGLDIESLLSSATSLIAGLLSGNKNFGTVLGIYVGTIFDGLSGGGGAINNGQFIGNFLGTVVAQLSADPEEDDVPPRPLIFLQNVVSSFMEAKNRIASDEEGGSEERKDHNKNGNKGGNKDGDKDKGSDSSAFIKHVASHIVGSLVSLLLNASLGASGGASHASASLFHGSSAGSNGGGKW